MKNSMLKPLTVLLWTILLTSLASGLACGLAPVKVADIKANPTKYEGKTITLRGKAVAGTKLPFMSQWFYEIDDGSGTLPVVTKKALPPEGNKVFVRGKVQTAFRIGGQSYGLVIMEGE